MEIRVGDKLIGENRPAFVIVEIACAHDGSLKKAKMLVDAAVKAKADAVQFIAFSTDTTTAPYHVAYSGGKKLEFNEFEWRELVKYAKNKKILVSAAVQDFDSARLMKELDLDIYKIHSPDLSNPELISFVARIRKPIIMTVGASTLDEVGLAVKAAKKAGNKDIILMYGFQNYPTRTERINLGLLRTLKNRFKCVIGYADHTDGNSPLTIILPILSTQLEASVLEKHITLNRAEKGTDHEAALNPDEFEQFVEFIRETEKALGDGIRHSFTEEELKYRELTKKSIVAARDINKGEKVRRSDILYLRAKPGLAPYESSKIIGKRLAKDIKKFEVISENHVK